MDFENTNTPAKSRLPATTSLQARVDHLASSETHQNCVHSFSATTTVSIALRLRAFAQATSSPIADGAVSLLHTHASFGDPTCRWLLDQILNARAGNEQVKRLIDTVSDDDPSNRTGLGAGLIANGEVMKALGLTVVTSNETSLTETTCKPKRSGGSNFPEAFDHGE